MSTRSTIGILDIVGNVSLIYCHNDGYLSNNGIILMRYYQDFEKVKLLISLGNMSSLAEEVEIPTGIDHSFNKKADKISTFYGRDRGEKDTDAYKCSFLNYKQSEQLQDYNYIFDESSNSWFLLNKSDQKLKKLLPLLIKDKEIKGENRQFIESLLNSIKMKKKLDDNLPEKLIFNIAKVKTKI